MRAKWGGCAYLSDYFVSETTERIWIKFNVGSTRKLLKKFNFASNQRSMTHLARLAESIERTESYEAVQCKVLYVLQFVSAVNGMQDHKDRMWDARLACSFPPLFFVIRMLNFVAFSPYS